MTVLTWTVLAAETGVALVVAGLAAAWARKRWSHAHRAPAPRQPVQLSPAPPATPTTDREPCTAA